METFQQYEERQRRERAAREQRLAEQQTRKEESQAAQMQQIAETLQVAEQQRREAQVTASQRMQEEKQAAKGNPIEDDFYRAWCEAYPAIELIRQHPIGRYRVDFAHLETMTVVELDGYQYHSKKKDRNKDYARQHEIEDQGWLFVRFTGSQIFTAVEACIRVTYKRIMARYGMVR